MIAQQIQSQEAKIIINKTPEVDKHKRNLLSVHEIRFARTTLIKKKKKKTITQEIKIKRNKIY